MKKNMGRADRALRVSAAVVIAALLLTGVLGGALAIILGVVAVAFLLTSAVGVCPAYLPLGLNTCSVQERKTTGA